MSRSERQHLAAPEKGTTLSKSVETVLLWTHGSEGSIPFSMSDYCENRKFVSMNRVVV